MKILLLVLGIVVAAVVGGLVWLGAFAQVRVQERDMGPYAFVYVQEATTDAAQIRAHTEALAARLEAAGYTKRRPMQVYYPAGRGIQNQIGFAVDRAVGNEVLGADTFFRPIPAQRCMVVRFPFRNLLSYRVGAARVERALEQHRAANKYADLNVMVILERDTIHFLQPIEPG